MEKKDVWTISSLLNWTVNYFKSKNIQSARLDAEVLLSHVLRQERIYLYVHFDEPMEQNELSKFREYVKKRAQHVPIAYIIGEREFMGLPFKVTKDTLIPRPDTEILVENVLNNVDKDKEIEIVDIGTGSGAIILSLLVNLPKAQGKTVDISSKAIEVAKENAVNLQVNDRCEFFVGDLFAPLNDNKFDVIVSNPPYIPNNQEIEAMVKDNEPHVALFGGNDGLYFYRRIFKEVKPLLKDRALLAFEMGFDQRELMEEALQTYFPDDRHEIIKDINGKDRMLFIYHNLK